MPSDDVAFVIPLDMKKTHDLASIEPFLYLDLGAQPQNLRADMRTHATSKRGIRKRAVPVTALGDQHLNNNSTSVNLVLVKSALGRRIVAHGRH